MPDGSTIALKIIGDIKVTVPSSPQYMSNFVLQEQQDWFEDEMDFLRSYIKPGMQVIDIGANYGVYTLTIARIVGQTGKVWAFEPTRATANCLQQSLLENGLTNVKLLRFGLSEKIGKATFYTSPNSELNSLSKIAGLANSREKISLLTLDYCHEKQGWQNIDFIKLDAEGAETDILKKGVKTLNTFSPLVMFELNHGGSVNLPLIDRFNKLGYSCYRLVPGLNILVPFDHHKPFDGFLLNLFCAKEDKAKTLEAEGVIVRSWQHEVSADSSAVEEHIAKMPFADSLRVQYSNNELPGSSSYLRILALYLKSQAGNATSAERVACLHASLAGLRTMLAEGEQRVARLVSFARIAFAAGARELGIQILGSLLEQYSESLDFELNEVLLPACPRYDTLPPAGNLKRWLLSSVIEEYVIKHAFSCYFSRESTLPLFEKYSSLGFSGTQMIRRRAIVSSCFSPKSQL